MTLSLLTVVKLNPRVCSLLCVSRTLILLIPSALLSQAFRTLHCLPPSASAINLHLSLQLKQVQNVRGKENRFRDACSGDGLYFGACLSLANVQEYNMSTV